MQTMSSQHHYGSHRPIYTHSSSATSVHVHPDESMTLPPITFGGDYAAQREPVSSYPTTLRLDEQGWRIKDAAHDSSSASAHGSLQPRPSISHSQDGNGLIPLRPIEAKRTNIPVPSLEERGKSHNQDRPSSPRTDGNGKLSWPTRIKLWHWLVY
jgi:hypothetical protein